MSSKPVTKFRGKHFFLSNFYPCQVEVFGRLFNSSEAAFMSQKSLDRDYRKSIAECKDAKEAKKLGSEVNLREDWEEIKESIMKESLLAKFSQNEELRQKLLSTQGLYLEEGNYWHDNFWGNCYCPRCFKNNGKNTLGVLLMEVRQIVNG